jgi:hypothetical protein
MQALAGGDEATAIIVVVTSEPVIPPPTERGDRLTWLAMALLAMVAMLLRLGAAQGDFWFDEVWSWMVVQQYVHSPLDVVLTLRHEINHFVNSWIIEALGPDQAWTMYRVPAVLLGVVTTLLAGVWGRGHGRACAILAMLFTGTSYVLVHYSSEARGYSPLLCFSLLGWVALDRLVRTRRQPWLAAWNVAAVLAVLSQPVFVSFFGAALVWTGLRLWDSGLRGRGLALTLARWHGGPMLFCGLLYAVNLRLVYYGGGVNEPPLRVVVRTLSLLVGGPYEGTGTQVAAAAALAAMAAALALLWRRQRDLAVFFTLAIVVGPAALMAVLGRLDLYVRYFLLSVTFTLLLWSVVLARGWGRGGATRAAVLLVVAVVMVGNGLHLSRLLTLGRGQYLEPLRRIQQETPGQGPITLAADHGFRYSRIVAFYSRHLDASRPIQMVDLRQQPQWLIMTEAFLQWQPESSLPLRPGVSYELQAVYPYAGLSGWQTALYRRVER